MSGVKRVFVEKKKPFAVNAKELHDEITGYLGIKTITDVRVLIRYDIENLSDETYKKALTTVFAEPPVDDVYENEFKASDDDFVFSVEYLPGQFDQRADSAEQCVKFLNENETPVIKTATTYIISGKLTDDDKAKIKNHCINPVDSRVADEKLPDTLVTKFDTPADVVVFDGFKDMSGDKLKELYDSLGLAMTFKDFKFIQDYFKNEENRDPSMTEIRVLDTYWSDHCRHTTFATELKNVEFKDGYYRAPMEETYNKYLADRAVIYKDRKDKFVCLMDLALMGMKKLKAEGKLEDQEESDEINACSIVVPVEIDGKTEEWLVNFKNETHNHPTEIEPFGGAATCLGGAIRDPLSGRTYVYQAMRITGAADPTVPVADTLHGKLPQRKIVTEAAHGYSSYGNQIGLATGYVKEIYHPDYVAKRMEIGAVIAAAPRSAVKRENSDPGDIIILLGGRTGRDGCGGATGSSKVHTEESIETCGAEVQKGNAPTERKMQRLFRRPEVTKLIKKCNDFGAGGVSVAIGELAAGLTIDLDKVPKKYEGLDGTELAISESQERMAVVVDPADVKAFLEYATEENLEAVEVAVVTEEPRLVLNWRGKDIVNISRAFLDTNGAHQETSVLVDIPDDKANYLEAKPVDDVKGRWLKTLADLNECSQKGLVERFDGSIGAGSVLMPFGGKYQLTETQAMVAKLPVLKGKCDTVTMMAYGFDPYLSKWSPYHGAMYAVTDSVAKIVAAGGDYSKIRFTYQEYFRRMTEDPSRWSQPFAALLGAYEAQIGLGLPSIGGKDSMSGSFEDLDVPPTLVSFAITGGDVHKVITPELKEAGHVLVEFMLPKDEFHVFDFEALRKQFDAVEALIQSGKAYSAYTVKDGGLVEAVYKMAFGNEIGVAFDDALTLNDLVEKNFGHIIVEVDSAEVVAGYENVRIIASTNEEKAVSYKGEKVTLDDAYEINCAPLESVYPTTAKAPTTEVRTGDCSERGKMFASKKYDEVNVVIPVFPGTNCEFDSKRAFEKAGAKVQLVLIRNKTEEDIKKSVDELEEAIHNAQIMMLPGGFSAGDEPEGSGKFIATVLRNPRLKAAIDDLLDNREGLMIGICNGFQALVKLGLLPHGHIKDMSKDDPTLTFNTIGRHLSQMVTTRVSSVKSPWLANVELGDEHIIPISHGEGRFVAPKEVLDQLIDNGQVAFQYVDPNGNVTMESPYNPNGSMYGIEGIVSEDGRVLGKMGHSERQGENRDLNIYGEMDQKLFEAGVKYFKGE